MLQEVQAYLHLRDHLLKSALNFKETLPKKFVPKQINSIPTLLGKGNAEHIDEFSENPLKDSLKSKGYEETNSRLKTDTNTIKKFFCYNANLESSQKSFLTVFGQI